MLGEREDAYGRAVVGQIVKGDLALNMARDDFKLLGGIVQQDMIYQDSMRLMRPQFLEIVFRR